MSALEPPLLDTTIYHCQQAAEKSIKGWLQLQDDPFAKTHDVEELADQAAKTDPTFSSLAGAAVVLTPYVSAYRYPGGAGDAMPLR